MSENKELQMLYGELIAKCWDDEAFKTRFVQEPEAVLREYGLPVQDGVEYVVVEAPKGVRYAVIPYDPPAELVKGLAKELLSGVENGRKTLLPEGMELRVLQNTETTRYVVLHEKPDTLTKAQLDMKVGGGKSAAVNYHYAVNVDVAVEAAVTVTTAAVNFEAAAVALVVGAIVLI